MKKLKITKKASNSFGEELEDAISMSHPPFLEEPEEPVTEIDSIMYGHFELGDRVYYINHRNMKIKRGTIRQFVWKCISGLFPYYKIELDNGDIVQDHELFRTLAEARAEVINKLKDSIIGDRDHIAALQHEIAVNERRLATLQSFDEKMRNKRSNLAQDNDKALPQMATYMRPKFTMSYFLDEYDPLPISGGWGYSKDDAVVIETEDSSIGVPLEYDFLEHRTMLELSQASPRLCDIEDYQRLKQSVRIIDDIHYDVIEAQVTVKWKDEDTSTTYKVEGWFNVEMLFNGYSKLLEKKQDDS